MSGMFGKTPSAPKPPAAPATAIDSGKEKARYDVMARLLRARRGTILNQAGAAEPQMLRKTLGGA